VKGALRRTVFFAFANGLFEVLIFCSQITKPGIRAKKRRGINMKKLFTMAFAVLAVAAFIGFSATSSDAVHKGSGSLTCGGCHTMHNTQGGDANTLGGDAGGTAVLLRGAAGATHAFCLNCHSENGTNAATVFAESSAPPKVLMAAAGTISASGSFNGILDVSAPFAAAGADAANDALGRGHSVGGSGSIVPPGGGADPAVSITCTSCHDPHGAPNNTGVWQTGGINLFRNLRTIPTGSGEAVGVTLSNTVAAAGSSSDGATGTTINWTGTGAGATHIWPVETATRNNIYGGNMSLWCATCHDAWHETNVPGNASGNDWLRHPVNNALVDATPNSGSGNPIVDAATAAPVGGNTLPAVDSVGTADDSLFASGLYDADNTGDKVMCLSCHYAHGGPNFDNLRWNYLSAVGAGTQTPLGLASGVGCNICHNK